jgi:putative ABC transport system permease protein
MTRAAFGAILSHWRRAPLQLAMLLAGLALATALWSGVQALNAEARAAYATAESLLADGGLARLEAAEGTFDQASFAQLRRAGWAVSPVVEGRATLGAARVSVLGIEPLSAGGNAALLADDDLTGFVTGTGFAHPQTLTEIGPTDMNLRPSDAVPVGTVLLDIGQAQSVLGQAGRISRLTVADSQRNGLTPLAELVPDLRLILPDSDVDLGGLTRSFHLNLTAFGLLAFAVGLFIVHSAVGLAFEQRRGLFRTLRALGVPLRSLLALLAVEMLVLGLVAGAMGLVLGYLMAAALLPDVALTLRGLYGAPVPGMLRFDPLWALAGLGMTLAGVSLAGAAALWRVWRLPLLAPAQPRAWARASARVLWVQIAGALILALLGIGLGVAGRGLLTGFALLAALLLASALLMPAILTVLLTLGQRLALGVVGQWFWADSRQNLPRLSLALMALMLALAANIGVGTMVASFRATFVGWIDQRLVAELNITPADAAEAARLLDWLTDRADAILPVQRVEATLADQPAEIYAMADHATFRDHWPMLQASAAHWDALAAGRGVMINEQLHHRAGLPLGAVLDLPGLGAINVIGIYPDYGNPRAQAIIGLDLFDRVYPGTQIRQLALRTDDPDALRAALLDEFGLNAQQITERDAARALSLAIFERTFVITGALNVLTLSVAAIALFASLVTLSGMRLVQLAPLWALGLTPAHLAGLELARALVLAALTMVCALPVGLILAHVLLAVINVQAFGWRLPMVLFPADWARLALWAGIAVLAAASLPAWRLWRQGGAPLLRVFAYER